MIQKKKCSIKVTYKNIKKRLRIYVGFYMINEITRRFSERITDI